MYFGATFIYFLMHSFLILLCTLLVCKKTHCIFIASWCDSITLHLHMLLKKQKQSADGLLVFLSRKYAFLSGCPSVQQTSNFSLWSRWGCSDEQNFLLILLLFFIFLFITAASDHYLIGNNITVAVLGIVIPIGEYTLTIHIVLALCLPASPSFACVKSSANCLCVWRFVSLAACCIILYVYAWTHTELLNICIFFYLLSLTVISEYQIIC